MTTSITDTDVAAGEDRMHAARHAVGVQIADLAKVFTRPDGAVVHAIDDVTVDIEPGEMVVLLGPSGCGKSTLLRCIAGLERPDSGSINLSGKPIYDSARGVSLPAEQRRLSMVFQSYALWPHMTVFRNVAYPLRYGGRRKGHAKQSKADIEAAVMRTLDLVGVSELRDQYPGRISGGQQQRVALARALVGGEGVILFDEPLSNIDAQVRERLRLELLEMHKRLGFTAVYVTHDQAEAMQLADKVAVLDRGKVVQYASPREVYARPATRYVANFVGNANELHGTRVDTTAEGHLLMRGPIGTFAVSGDAARLGPDGDGCAISRPESVVVSREPIDGVNAFAGTLRGSSYFGTHADLDIDVDGVTVRARSGADHDLREGDRVHLSIDPSDLHLVST